jgi:hypothetical protein
VFLLQTLNRLSNVETVPSATAPSAADSTEQAAKEPGAPAPQALGPLDPVEGHVLARHVKSVFRCWVILFGLVGAQMSWVLRPFVGNPDQPFEWFRARESNFFEAVWSVVQSLVS